MLSMSTVQALTSAGANFDTNTSSIVCPTSLTNLGLSASQSKPLLVQPHTERALAVLRAFGEALKARPTAPNIYLAEDSFVKGSGRLIGLEGGGQELLAHYELIHLELAHLGLHDSYDPLLEPGNWLLVEASPAAVYLKLPFAIWHCHRCQTLTPSSGEETILACKGCGYILVEDEEAD